MPAPLKKCPSRSPSGAPPATANFTRPPTAALRSPETPAPPAYLGVPFALAWQGAAVGDRGLGRGGEDLLLGIAGRGLLLGRVVDLLEDPGHGEQEGRAGLRQSLGDRRRVGPVHEDRA